MFLLQNVILISTKGNIMDTENTEQNQSNVNQQTQDGRRVSAAETDFDLATVSSSALQQLLNARRSTTTQAVQPSAEQIDYNLSSYFFPPPLIQLMRLKRL